MALRFTRDAAAKRGEDCVRSSRLRIPGAAGATEHPSHPARIAMLLKFFPDPAVRAGRYRALQPHAGFRIRAQLRDFLLMHYAHTERRGVLGALDAIPLTETLQEKIDLFRSRGRILRETPSCSDPELALGDDRTEHRAARLRSMTDSLEAAKVARNSRPSARR